MESFSPLRPQDAAFTKELLADAHAMFISWVKDRRGTRLTAPDDAVFDGGYMLGDKAKTLGLIDGFGDLDSLVKQLGGPKAKPLLLKPKRPRGIIRLLTRGSVNAIIDAAEQKLLTPTLR